MLSNNSFTVSNLFGFRVKRQRVARLFGTKINFVFIKCSSINQCRRRVAALDGAGVDRRGVFAKVLSTGGGAVDSQFTRRTLKQYPFVSGHIFYKGLEDAKSCVKCCQTESFRFGTKSH